jgi:hypothetical protein
VRCQFDDGWTPSHLSSGAANLYKEIAIALKAAEWRQPGLVALISKVATSAGEREPLKFNVPASYEPRTGPNSWAAARRDALPDVVPEVEGDNLMAQPDAPPAVATEVKGENVVAEQSTEPAMMMATLPETESPKATASPMARLSADPIAALSHRVKSMLFSADQLADGKDAEPTNLAA